MNEPANPQLAEIADEMTKLANWQDGDVESDHIRGDDLLLTALQLLAPDSPSVTRIISAWRNASNKWWYA